MDREVSESDRDWIYDNTITKKLNFNIYISEFNFIKNSDIYIKVKPDLYY